MRQSTKVKVTSAVKRRDNWTFTQKEEKKLRKGVEAEKRTTEQV